ncbi:hypothetical protein CHU32_03750 [Superficieibacter electus]|uniref:Uncharacterized protein n=1 Tax=Superficieibacter electus TaxID=2022662 RepID=A0A2P5GVF5_9ENTR|nr:hypothetical protein [Superficieibacter electus]POP42359.1 hypothetical protein CHU33_20035 [Superficieibacter electus]POP50548.1 hypothetical protein CHU32_03750 [Superficieibacter electus]
MNYKTQFDNWFAREYPRGDEVMKFGMWQAFEYAMELFLPGMSEMAAENIALKTAAEFAVADDLWVDLGDDTYRYQYCEWYADDLRAALNTPITDLFFNGKINQEDL